ncbi:nuclear protein [Musa troglodytarum]|uniref:Nuclear protein n=1 Tax=Musa troglodytarum TaxID=320322 RepID=A0A9E7KHY3_9LILI|nr:nuclear protein [Musa troglodytarum]
MDESWRFRPAQGHLCPVCSIPHFPFCPIPPPPLTHAFDRYHTPADEFHRFPPGLAPPFPHDLPPWDHREPPPLPYAPEPWGVNRSFERNSFRPVSHPPQRFLQDEFLGGETSYKRMRVEDPLMGTFHPPSSHDRFEFAPGRTSSDNERRLNLIRDHGKPNAVEGPPQSSGEFLPDRFVRDGLLPPDTFVFNGPQNQYRDVVTDHGFDGPRISSVGRSGQILPLESNFGSQNQFLRPTPLEEHRNFPGALSSQGDDQFVSCERLDFERVGPNDSRLGEYRNAHYERKDFGRGPEVGNVHSDISFQRYDSCKDGGSLSSSEYNATHVTDKQPFSVMGHQAIYRTPDYVSRNKLEGYDQHDFQKLHPSKSSPYPLPKQPQYLEQGSHRLAQDTVGNELKSSYPAFGEPIRNIFDLTNQWTEAPESKVPDANDIHRVLKPVNYTLVEQSNAKNHVVQGGLRPLPGMNNSNGMIEEMHSQVHTPGLYPSVSPPRLSAGHREPFLNHIPASSSVPSVPPPTLFPVLASASGTTSLPPNQIFPDPHALPRGSSYAEQPPHPTEIATEMFEFMNNDDAGFASHPTSTIKALSRSSTKCFSESQPHRASRPDHIVVILRGLPGSGKSYLAKMLRDLEIENGGNAPRIHAMDDYFMIEVEKKVDDNEGSKSSSSSRVKKQTTKKVVEYCYEPEMEEKIGTERASYALKDMKATPDRQGNSWLDSASDKERNVYRSSMLKAFKKTLEEGIFTFIIVDDRNLRVADFAQFWAVAKNLWFYEKKNPNPRSGYEVYLLEAPYKDPTGCAARNVHGFTQEGIQNMAEKWEEAPPLYLRLDIQSLFRGDDLNEHSIQEEGREKRRKKGQEEKGSRQWKRVGGGKEEGRLRLKRKVAANERMGGARGGASVGKVEKVDMDINDSDCDDDGTKLQDEESLKPSEPKSVDYVPDKDLSKVGEKWDSEEEEEGQTRIKELGSSKWSKDLEEDIENSENVQGNINALSGLIQAYSKSGKSVHWGDQADKSGFSIGAMKKQISLIIGPGSGYNLASNPMVEEQDSAGATESSSMSESKRRFSEKLRAEHESFRTIFSKRRQRIGGFFNMEDD